MRKLAVLGVLLILADCAPDIYDKPGATQEEFNADLGGCQMYVAGIPQAQAPYVPPSYTTTTTMQGSYGYGQVSGSAISTTTPDYSGQAFANLGTAIGNAVRERNTLRACMASKGYTLRRNN